MAIVVFCAWRGYRNGLIRGVFGVVALVVAVLVANVAATAYSEEVTGMLNPFVGGVVDTALADILEENIEYDLIDHDNDSEDFLTAFTALRRIGLPEAAAIRVAEKAVEGEPEGFLTDMIASGLSSALAYAAVFGIAFVLIAIVFAVVGNLIGFVFSLPGLKLVDTVAGIIFGTAKGLIIVFTIATVLRYFGLLATSTLEETSVLNYLVNNNPIADMLGI